MAITTYAELQEAIATWMIRTDMADLASQFIALAEQRFNRLLRVPEMENVATSTVVEGTITLPTDFLQVRSVYLNVDPKIALEQMTPAQLTTAYPYPYTGTPTHYALQAGNEMAFGPAPDEDYAIVLNYYAKIPALSDSEPANWLLASHPDLYLAASLAEGFALTIDAERGLYWAGRANEALAELRQQGVKKAYAGPLRARSNTAPSGALARY